MKEKPSMAKNKTPKQNNTPEYRKEKRITAFVSGDLKKKILSAATKSGHSVSKEAGAALRAYYLGL
jgi:hypothetical protein